MTTELREKNEDKILQYESNIYLLKTLNTYIIQNKSSSKFFHLPGKNITLLDF